MRNLTLLGILFVFTFTSSAASILGGDMELKYDGSHHSNIITLYNDCQGSSAPDSILIHYQCLSNDSFNFTSYAQPYLTPTYNSNTGCLPLTSTCMGGSTFGFQTFIYQHNIQMNQNEKWKVWLSIAGRAQTNSCQYSASQDFYIQSILDFRYIGENSSPRYYFPGHTFFYTNHSFTWNIIIASSDSDSLSYYFTAPLSDSITPLVYNASLSPIDFVPSNTPVTFDPSSQNLSVNINQQFVGITKLVVQEWRNVNGVMKIISESDKDILIHTEDIINQSPLLSGMDFQLHNDYSVNDTLFSTEIYASDTLHFFIHAHDLDSGKNASCSNAANLNMAIQESSSVIAPSNFTQHNNDTDSAFMEVQWIPKWEDVSSTPYKISLRVKDHWHYYGTNGIKIFDYYIKVKENPNSIDKNANSNGNDFIAFPNPAKNNITLYFEREMQNAEITIVNATGKIVFQDSYRNQKEIMLNTNPLESGFYIIKAEGNGREYYRKIIVE